MFCWVPPSWARSSFCLPAPPLVPMPTTWSRAKNASLEFPNAPLKEVVLEKTLENPLDSKKIKPVPPKGNPSWIFIGRTDAKAPKLWPPDTELNYWKRPWCWERLKVGGEGDDRGWDGWMASPTQWTWVWVNSRRWWWTGKPGMLHSMGSQRVRHDWATDQQQRMWVHLLVRNTGGGNPRREGAEDPEPFLLCPYIRPGLRQSTIICPQPPLPKLIQDAPPHTKVIWIFWWNHDFPWEASKLPSMHSPYQLSWGEGGGCSFPRQGWVAGLVTAFPLPLMGLIGEGKGKPLQLSCLENSVDRGAW